MRIEQDSLWLIDFDPSRGHEIQKTRPALVLSNTYYNLAAGTIFVVPLTSKKPDPRLQHLFVEVKSTPENGLITDSHANITQHRTVSKQRFVKQLGALQADKLRQEIVKKYLELVGVNPLEIRYGLGED